MEFVSRDSLVEEITGIKKTDLGWDAARQEIYQFDKILMGASSSNNTQKIPVEYKDGFVTLMKSIYHSDELRTVFKKFGRKKHLSDKEQLLLYSTIVNSINDGKSRDIFNQMRDELEEEPVLDKCNELYKEIKDFSDYMGYIPIKSTIYILDLLKKDIQERIEYYKVQLDPYKDILNSIHEDINRVVD